MRRLARISGGGALLDRTSSALQVWLWLLIFVFQNEFRISRSIQPGYLDFDNLPDTNFTCEGKVIGGYYADLETSCQMFHVCTVGQQEEPMDIKFLCLNGTVFDQETRVCERVDEVDCTKSEKFYSLNLELYGSTIAPPKPDPIKPQDKSTAPTPQAKPHRDQESDPSLDDERSHRNEGQPDVPDSTEDPIQETKGDPPRKPPDFIQSIGPTSLGHVGHEEPLEENQEEDEFDSENPDYEEEYTRIPPTTTQAVTTTRKSYTTTTRPPPTAPQPPQPPPAPPSSPTLSPSLSSAPATSDQPTLDPALLSPQEFIYRHRGPGSEAISFQRQSFRPADGVYITHAPPQQQAPQQQQFDHFQYESSRTAPRPGAPRPTPFVQRPQPAPFRATTLDPRDQMSRPGPSSQSSERHETSIKHRPQPYLPPLPAQRPLPFDPYYYDRKRSDETATEISSLSARSVAPPVVTERPTTKPKSPPRVIVTASASVSDSNGKRLNYTVGNVVSAVKPIVPINYDDYKESDLIFDPFFLDVPKLKNRRKSRESRNNRKVIIVSVERTTKSNVPSQATIAHTPVTTQITTTSTTTSWNPNDYVDDNYEPHAYKPPAPPIALLLPHDSIEDKEDKEKQFINEVQNDGVHSEVNTKVKFEEPISATTAAWNSNDYVDDNYEPHGYNPGHGPESSKKYSVNELKEHRQSKVRIEEPRPMSSPDVQSTSSQFTAAEAPAHPARVACRTPDCRTRA